MRHRCRLVEESAWMSLVVARALRFPNTMLGMSRSPRGLLGVGTASGAGFWTARRRGQQRPEALQAASSIPVRVVLGVVWRPALAGARALTARPITSHVILPRRRTVKSRRRGVLICAGRLGVLRSGALSMRRSRRPDLAEVGSQVCRAQLLVCNCARLEMFSHLHI